MSPATPDNGVGTVPGGASSPPGTAALELTGIVKSFGSQRALDGVNFELRGGEVHTLLGENGAGKTTLMNIASGMLRADAGSIAVDGKKVSIPTPAVAMSYGIGMVHQHYRLVERLTVAENLAIGWHETPRVVSRGALVDWAAEVCDRYGLQVEPRAAVDTLSAGERQRVAIVRALSRGARILILDEPTALLTPHEADALFENVRRMAGEGHGVVFISHKLREVMEISDRISVLRGGQLVATLARADAEVRELARMTVATDVPDVPVERASKSGRPILVATGASVGDHDEGRLHEIDLEIREHEVLGVAGVSGNGQVQLAELLTGTCEHDSGTVTQFEGGEAVNPTKGVGHIPEHHSQGLALAASLEFNAVLRSITKPPLRRGLVISRRRLRTAARELVDRAGLKKLQVQRPAGTLSGGQMQRLLVHRELDAGSRLLVAVHPTRGLDVAATNHVQMELLAARDRGVAVVLISEDLDEVLEMSDRIVVLYEGRIAGELARPEFDRNRLGLLMGGAA
ncbi:MAG: ABC transporter ATP-binding protein [Actinobacteria bacterium]|nr:ABC transporter ATP-binding protein [Actinomycetota bacterium]